MERNEVRDGSMRKVSAYIIELAKAISDDLRDSLPKDKLQHEVEMELEKQVLANLVTAISEYNCARIYNKSDVSLQNIKRRQVLRMMGYCGEMWIAQEQVKGMLMGGSQMVEADFEVSQ
jgi:hypothetical protein